MRYLYEKISSKVSIIITFSFCSSSSWTWSQIFCWWHLLATAMAMTRWTDVFQAAIFFGCTPCKMGNTKMDLTSPRYTNTLIQDLETESKATHETHTQECPNNLRHANSNRYITHVHLVHLNSRDQLVCLHFIGNSWCLLCLHILVKSVVNKDTTKVGSNGIGQI